MIVGDLYAGLAVVAVADEGLILGYDNIDE